MVTKEMTQRGEVVAVLDYDMYTRLIGTINNNLPGRHIFISPEKVKDQKGRKLVLLWCAYPKIAEIAVKRALGIPVEPEASKQIEEVFPKGKPYVFFPPALAPKPEGQVVKPVPYVHKRRHIYWKDRAKYTVHD